MRVKKLTRKGQLTIPAEYRRQLGTDVVEVFMEGDKVIIRPVRKLGGIFHKYAAKDRPIEEIIKMEEEVARNAFTETQNSG